MNPLILSQYTHLLQAVDHIKKAQAWAECDQHLAHPSAHSHLRAAVRHLFEAMADADALEAVREQLVQTTVRVEGANDTNGGH
jgi:hypothetical protein